MFGLMRAKQCGMSAEEKHFRRLNYCGTCKTMGSLYGQKSRLLLNHDTVFLAEILTSLSDQKVEKWHKAYQSYNCLSLPKAEMPISLQFAATANVILAEFKIADHVSDTRLRRFRLAQRIFSKDFLKAEKILKDWNFPLEKVRQLLATQEERESESSSLDELSLPTAAATATFFSEGAKMIGRGEFAGLTHEMGFAFGQLIYLLDAFEDFEKDAKTKQFNALRVCFGDQSKRKAIPMMLELETEIISKIYDLPISEQKKQIFSTRLRSNLQKKLKTNLPVLVCRPKKRLAFSERFERAKTRARELTASHSWASILPIFVFVLAFAFLSPTHAREAKSARECAELSFNLMFLGSIVGAVLAFPTKLLQEGYNPPPTPGDKKALKKKAKGGGGGNNSGCFLCCCDCDSCDCCCDSCDCCSDCGGCCDC